MKFTEELIETAGYFLRAVKIALSKGMEEAIKFSAEKALPAIKKYLLYTTFIAALGLIPSIIATVVGVKTENRWVLLFAGFYNAIILVVLLIALAPLGVGVSVAVSGVKKGIQRYAQFIVGVFYTKLLFVLLAMFVSFKNNPGLVPPFVIVAFLTGMILSSVLKTKHLAYIVLPVFAVMLISFAFPWTTKPAIKILRGCEQEIAGPKEIYSSCDQLYGEGALYGDGSPKYVYLFNAEEKKYRKFIGEVGDKTFGKPLQPLTEEELQKCKEFEKMQAKMQVPDQIPDEEEDKEKPDDRDKKNPPLPPESIPETPPVPGPDKRPTPKAEEPGPERITPKPGKPSDTEGGIAEVVPPTKEPEKPKVTAGSYLKEEIINGAGTQVALMVIGDFGDISLEESRLLAEALGNFARVAKLSRKFVSDGLFRKIFNGETSDVLRLGFAENVDYLVLAEYSSGPASRKPSLLGSGESYKVVSRMKVRIISASSGKTEYFEVEHDSLTFNEQSSRLQSRAGVVRKAGDEITRRI